MLRYRYNDQPVAAGERDMYLGPDGRLAIRTGLIAADIDGETITYRLREVYDDAPGGTLSLDFQV